MRRRTLAKPRKREAGSARWSIRSTLKQALVLYEIEIKAARDRDDLQAIQFWESHAAVVKDVLDQLKLCRSCAAKALR